MLPDNGRDFFWILFYFRQLHSGKKPAIIMTLSMRVSVNFSRVPWMMLVRSFKSDFPCRDTSRPNMAALRYHSHSLTFSCAVFLNLNMRENLSLGGNLTCWTLILSRSSRWPTVCYWNCNFKITISSRWWLFYIFSSILIFLCCNRYRLFLVSFSYFLIFLLKKTRPMICF